LVDCRVPPNLTTDEAKEQILAALAPLPDGVEVDWGMTVPGNDSPAHGELFDAIQEWLGEHVPGAGIVPTFLPGFTDSRTWRTTFPECVAYGFFPHRHQTLYETAPLVHSANERIDVRDLGYATRCYADIIKERLG
ncbi:MAG: peptidase, partial [Solirubrobacterales bacterium]|nr:peptidase [Solirubrobacterales bacterium]